MAVFYKSDSVPAAVASSLLLPRPVDTIVMVGGLLYRSTNATVATYTGVGLAPGAVISVGDDDFSIYDNGSTTRIMDFSAANITAGNTRTLTMADADIDLGYAVRRALVTIPAGNGAGNVGDLNTTPVTVVAAPAAGFFIEVVSAHFFLDFVSAAYDAAATTQLRYTNGAGAAILGTAVPSANLITAAADAHVISVVADNIVPVAAAPIVVHTSADPFAAAGDSPLVVEVLYRVLALSPS